MFSKSSFEGARSKSKTSGSYQTASLNPRASSYSNYSGYSNFAHDTGSYDVGKGNSAKSGNGSADGGKKTGGGNFGIG